MYYTHTHQGNRLIERDGEMEGTEIFLSFMNERERECGRKRVKEVQKEKKNEREEAPQRALREPIPFHLPPTYWNPAR